MKKHLLTVVLLTLLINLRVYAQTPNDKFRDANSIGPYPVFLTLQGVGGLGFGGFKNLSKDLAPFLRSEERKNLRGWEITGGFVINEKKIWNWYIEPVCFRNLSKQQMGADQHLKFIHQSTSFRFGRRWNIFYPVTVHYQVGIIYHRQIIAIIDSVRTTNGPSTTQVRVVNTAIKNGRILLPGVDGLIRLNVLDPTGSSGGLGIFLEGYGAFYTKNNTFSLKRLIPEIESDKAFKSDNLIFGFSFGVIIPLALRIK